jgi:hypothetical protein
MMAWHVKFIFPKWLPWPLIGPFDGPRNKSRHRPITEEMFKYGVAPVSHHVRRFKRDLAPWGGHMKFLKNQDWKDGPGYHGYVLHDIPLSQVIFNS